MTTSMPIATAPLRRLFVALLALGALVSFAAPASAQYGGAVNFFVDPVRVEIDGTFDYFGSSCAAGGPVTITIDGFVEVLEVTIAFDDSSFAGTDVPMPSGVEAGEDYVVRATCGGATATVVIRAVCNDGSDPVDDECPGGTTVGTGPTTTTTAPPPTSSTTSTTTTPTTTPTTTVDPDEGTGGSAQGTGGTGDDNTGDDGTGAGNNDPATGGGTTQQTDDGGTGGTSPDLAVTGASFVEQAAQIGATLVGLGAVFVLIATKRREHAAA